MLNFQQWQAASANGEDLDHIASPPTTTFRGWLKCINPSRLNTAEQKAMGMCFPEFGIQSQSSEEQQRFDKFKERFPGITHLRQPRPSRRYSGDMYGQGDLPRGRYHTLAYDATGNDFGTLVRELMAYSDVSRTGSISICELPSAGASDQETTVQTDGMLALLFNSNSDERTGIVETLEHLGVLEHVSEPYSHAMLVPYQVQYAEIESVLDLRTPESRQWLVEEFASKNSRCFYKARREGAEQFVKLLATLLNLEHGGSMFTAALGAWLRLEGVDGLVFPSARTNCGVVYENERITAYKGWNFVDYRNAPPPTFRNFVDMDHGWPEHVGYDAHLIVVTDGPASWMVEGLEEWHRERKHRYGAYSVVAID